MNKQKPKLQTEKPRGYFKTRDEHPNVKGYLFESYRGIKSKWPERWKREELFPKSRNITTLEHTTLQTGSSVGSRKYRDEHPRVKGYVFQYYKKDGKESWIKEKHILKKLSNRVTLQTGKPYGTFNHRASHPSNDEYLFVRYKYKKKDGSWLEEWKKKDKFPVNAHKNLQTGRPKGAFSRYDEHPNVPNYLYAYWSKFHHEKHGSGEVWWSVEYWRKKIKDFDLLRSNKELRPEKQNIKKGFLTDLTNPDNVYLLGEGWADGWIQGGLKGISSLDKSPKGRKVGFTMVDYDFNDNNFKELFNKYGVTSGTKKPTSAGGKNSFKSKNKSFRPSIYNNYEIYEFLKENDYGLKSHKDGDPTKILSKIPKELRYLWWRGFLDGDGSVGFPICIISFHSHYDQDWTFVKNLCKDLGITKLRINRTKDETSKSSANISQISNVVKLINYIWPNNSIDIGFKRKFDQAQKIRLKYQSILKKSENRYISFSKRDAERWTGSHGGGRKQGKFWHVRILSNGKTAYSAYFETKEEAKGARDEFLLKNKVIHLKHNIYTELN